MKETIKIMNSETLFKNEFYIFSSNLHVPKTMDNSINKREKINSLIKIGEIYSTGIFPEFIAPENDVIKIIGEYNLELERQKSFSTYPSRCASIYVFPTINEVNKVKTLYNWGNHNSAYRFLLKVKINTQKPYKISLHNMEIVSSLRGGYTNCSLASYWEGSHRSIIYEWGSYYPISELLIEGEVLVIESNPLY